MGDVTAEGILPLAVSYVGPTATDLTDGTFNATCFPPSGSVFTTNDTTVTCTARDTAQNDAVQTTFRVIVTPPPNVDRQVHNPNDDQQRAAQLSETPSTDEPSTIKMTHLKDKKMKKFVDGMTVHRYNLRIKSSLSPRL